MPYRFVRARPLSDRMAELRDQLDDGAIAAMEPFGETVTTSLNDARFDPDTGEAVWVEEDYCTPPLAMEREAVLDDYFEAITIVDPDVDETAGWKRIDRLPSLWDRLETER
ncbi:MAG: hypothetical protein ACQET5_06950 [Halobacteriota archaeon]|uniref:hypothetical protein n=1 Tax=Natronomonas sp. TaxID=2184060 RepID=UPI0039755953